MAKELAVSVQRKQRHALADLAKLFLKLGIIGFGGPAVHIAMMQDEVVRKRRWMTDDHFLDLVGATNLIPGPNSTEMTMHIGRERAGWKGLVVAGSCFIVPAVLITALLAWLYKQYGELPQVQPFVYGIKPAIIAIVISLMVALGRKALKSIELGVLGVLAAAAVLAGFNEIYVLFGSGLAGMLLYYLRLSNKTANGFIPVVLLQIIAQPAYLSNMQIFLVFLKIGSILYGSGYVLFAFLDAELVTSGILSRQQLVDAIAVGQVTPGPVFSSATFIGWQVGGVEAAILATVGIFLPSFLFVALLNPLVARLRKQKIMSAFLDSVNMASVAIILAVVVEMGREALFDWRTTVIAIVSFFVSFYFRKLNTAFVVLGGAGLGYALSLL